MNTRTNTKPVRTKLATKVAPQPGSLTAEDFKEAGSWPTVQEVADSYGIRKRWLLDMIADRKFRVIRLNSLRVDPEDLTRFLNDLNEKFTDTEPG